MYNFTKSIFSAVLVSSLAYGGAAFAGSFDTKDMTELRLPGSSPVMDCASLAFKGEYDYTIYSAELIPAAGDVLEHCQLDGIIRPEIRFQVNLPTQWNGRFYMSGNGAFAGTQPGTGRAKTRDNALKYGFATAYTDTGHNSSAFSTSFAFQNLSKEVDYTYRSVQLTAITAKDLLKEFYGKSENYAYWDGCSTGGRQGLMFAQRYPDMFDGIVAAAPIPNFTDLMVAFVWNILALESSEPLTAAHMKTIADTIYAQCDAVDGAKDGLIRDPRMCTFDPEKDLPKTGDVSFSDGQIASLLKVYGGVQSNGKQYYPGWPMGAEIADAKGNPMWNNWMYKADGSGGTIQEIMGKAFMDNLAFVPDDPKNDWRKFDFDKDPARITTIRKMLDTTNPDLTRFAKSGGRMITYHGWADTGVTPYLTTGYYDDVIKAMNGKAQDSYRLFMVPGMGHCGGGIGASKIDAMSSVIDWVESHKTPTQLVATGGGADGKGSVLMCPYPQAAKYKGSGDAMDQANWTCGN